MDERISPPLKAVDTPPATTGGAGKKTRELLTDQRRHKLREQVQWLRKDAGYPAWHTPGLIAAIRKCEETIPTQADLYAVVFAVAADPKARTPEAIGRPWAVDRGASRDAVDAAKRRSRSYDLPCPEHPEHRGKCPVCAAIVPVPPGPEQRALMRAVFASRPRKSDHDEARLRSRSRESA